MDYGLKDKVALVTGAARDVGREIASALADEGVKIAVNYKSSDDSAHSLVKELQTKDIFSKSYRCDIANYEAVKDMCDLIVSDFGGIDILVNNAGYVVPKRFVETQPADWQQQIDVGLYGVINCCHAVTPHMVRRGGGRIINLAGDSARVGERGLSITAASRGGALSLTKSLAKELGRDNITVNAVSLGLIDTSHSDKEWLASNMAKIVRNYPLGRIGQPKDVAPAVAFLSSDGAAWITGQFLSISGGYSMAD